MITRAAFMALLAIGAMVIALPASAQNERLTIQDKPGESSGRMPAQQPSGKRSVPTLQTGDTGPADHQLPALSASSRISPIK